MSRFRVVGWTAIVVASAIGMPRMAEAAPLDTVFGGAPFKDTSLPGTTSGLRPELAGLVIEDVSQPFSKPELNISGNVQSRVVRETASGTLDFVWRITVDPTSTGGGVSAFRLSDFGFSNITDGDWRVDSLGSVHPRTARVFNPAADPATAGGSVSFIFIDPIVLPGDPASDLNGSHTFFLRTTATNYAMTAMYDLLVGANGAPTAISYSTFAPAEVPEPTTAFIAFLGLAFASAVRKSR